MASSDVRFQYIYPLLYLLMKRDLNLFELAKTRVLHDEELWDSADSITWVYEAVRVRMNDLRGMGMTLRSRGNC